MAMKRPTNHGPVPPGLRALFDSVATRFPGHTMQRVRLPDGRIRYTYASPGMQETFGLNPETVIAEESASHDWIDPEDRPRFLDALARSADRLETLDEEVRVRGQDGQQRWVRSISHPRRMIDGTIVWDGIAIDVTERRETELALQRMVELARNAEAAQSRALDFRGQRPHLALVEIEPHLQALARFPETSQHIAAIRAVLSSSFDGPARTAGAAESSGKTLTPRQRSVLALLARGMSNQAIAHELGIDPGTVKLHVRAVMKRLGVKNRTAAAMMAERVL